MRAKASVKTGRTAVTVWDDEMGKPVRRTFVPAAAADELAEACRRALKWWRDDGPDDATDRRYVAAALAKHTGGGP